MNNDFLEEKEEEMDMSFVEPKSHHFGAIFLILLILVVAAGGVYFFVLNTPKRLFTGVFDKLISTNDYQLSLANAKENSTIDYKIGTKIDSSDELLKELSTILSKFTASGTINIDHDKNILEIATNIKYKTEELLDLTTRMELDNNIGYVHAKNILDKVIKFDIEESSDEEEINPKDYLIASRSFLKASRESLDNATYKRTIERVDNQFLKKQTMIVDSSFDKMIYTKLLHDSDFLESVSNITGKTITEVSDSINKEISELEDFTESITVYTTIIKDEFVKLECDLGEDNITVNKKEDKYNFEYVEDYNIVLKGYIKLNRENNSNLLAINLDLVEEKTIFDITLEYSKKALGSELLDTTNAVEYEKITEEEMNKSDENLANNKAYRYLIEDLGLLSQSEDTTLSA